MKPTLLLPLAILVAGSLVAGVSAQDDAPATCQPKPWKDACVIWEGNEIGGLNLASQPVAIVISETRATFDGTQQGWLVTGRTRDGNVETIEFFGPVTGDLAAGELGDILPVLPATGVE